MHGTSYEVPALLTITKIYNCVVNRNTNMGRSSRIPIAAGDRFGFLEVVEPDSGKRECGHVVARVRCVTCNSACWDCHGESFEVRVDNLRSRRTTSCGKVKRALRSQYMREKQARIEAREYPGALDSLTGKPIR